jgi:hypothetical protein
VATHLIHADVWRQQPLLLQQQAAQRLGVAPVQEKVRGLQHVGEQWVQRAVHEQRAAARAARVAHRARHQLVGVGAVDLRGALGA